MECVAFFVISTIDNRFLTHVYAYNDNKDDNFFDFTWDCILRTFQNYKLRRCLNCHNPKSNICTLLMRVRNYKSAQDRKSSHWNLNHQMFFGSEKLYKLLPDKSEECNQRIPYKMLWFLVLLFFFCDPVCSLCVRDFINWLADIL